MAGMVRWARWGGTVWSSALCLGLLACGTLQPATPESAGGDPARSGLATAAPAPPLAPAHGHHHRQADAYLHRPDAALLVFDAGLGVYAVDGMPRHYFWEGMYLRVDQGRWFMSGRLDGHWLRRATGSVPVDLRARYALAEPDRHPAAGPARWGR